MCDARFGQESGNSKTRDSNLADLISMYPQCFEGIGELPGDYKMILWEEAKPVVHAPRRVAAALREPLRQELNMLVNEGIIAKVEKPTEWILFWHLSPIHLRLAPS
ncbi:hypothetical protein PR048_017030 [Dryococelus australis]|uniref:Uncharacterized protein n=1 Tax=Dryococelus australis TaxID=614101 RepID=A0ABQ9H8D2_9NEOP|nr:hypothetical protein PR048_017030 [Dryococelus australis]